MRKKAFVWTLATILLVTVPPAEAQQQANVAKVGFLVAQAASSYASQREAFQRVFREIGYVEGKNLAFEYRYGEDKYDRLPALADELVRLKVDVLVVSSTPAALAAKNATRTIPIVFVNVGDAIGYGLVDSLARPGGNITGLTTIAAELTGKRLELLKETVPKLTRVAVLWDSRSAGQWKESQLPARELGLQLHSMEVSSADKFDNAFKEATKARSGALVVGGGPFILSSLKRIADLAMKERLPSIYSRGDYVVSGGLM